VCETSKYSDMHLFGLGLCYVFHTHDPLGSREYTSGSSTARLRSALLYLTEMLYMIFIRSSLYRFIIN
jgi:hypothetical protein